MPFNYKKYTFPTYDLQGNRLKDLFVCADSEQEALQRASQDMDRQCILGTLGEPSIENSASLGEGDTSSLYW